MKKTINQKEADLIELRSHFLPVCVVVCFSEKAYRRFIKDPNEEYLTKQAMTRIEYSNEKGVPPLLLLCFDRDDLESRDIPDCCGLICHEILHCIAFLDEAIGQTNRTDSEWESYFAQYVMFEIMNSLNFDKRKRECSSGDLEEPYREKHFNKTISSYPKPYKEKAE